MTKGKGTGRSLREVLKPVDDRKVGKRKAAYKPVKSSAPKSKKEKAAMKDPNKPKKTSHEEFRKTFKAENPNVKGVSAVGKAGGERWKSMTAAEKAPYEAKAAKRKVEYEKLMNAYNKKEISPDDGDEESDKSKSEVDEEDHQDEDEDDEDEDEDEDDEDDD